MRELNFYDLPSEIMTKVFRYLDMVNLKNATLTCKLWNDVIESACRWPLKLYYECDGDPFRVQKMNFILSTNRKFGTIEIKWGRLSENSTILKIFQKHGFNVTKLILRECHIDNLSVFADLLNLTPNLKHAVIEQRDLLGISDVPPGLVLPDLKRLKNLRISVSDERIVKCFRKAKLTAMHVLDYDTSEHHDALVDFLASQEKLTSLTVYAHSRSRSILAEMGKLNVPIPFRLMHLEISDGYGRNAVDHDNLLRFVKSQAENLKELEIGCKIPSSVCEYIFAGMTKLDTLRVRLVEVPTDNDFYERFVENCSVRTLELRNASLDDFPYLGNFLKKLPNIRDLILPYPGFADRHTLVMAHNLIRLESLCIYYISERLIDCVKFPNLTTLHIKYLGCKLNWDEFTRIHPRLAELTIETMKEKSCLTSDDIDQITSNVDLQSIRLGRGFVADERFFKIIRTKCPNLKVLDLDKTCIRHILSKNMRINLLRLCDDIKSQSTFAM